jgi:hypothetical protein
VGGGSRECVAPSRSFLLQGSGPSPLAQPQHVSEQAPFRSRPRSHHRQYDLAHVRKVRDVPPVQPLRLPTHSHHHGPNSQSLLDLAQTLQSSLFQDSKTIHAPAYAVAQRRTAPKPALYTRNRVPRPPVWREAPRSKPRSVKVFEGSVSGPSACCLPEEPAAGKCTSKCSILAAGESV